MYARSAASLRIRWSFGASRTKSCYEHDHLIHHRFAVVPRSHSNRARRGIRSEGYGLPASGEGYGVIAQPKRLPLWGSWQIA